MSYIQLYIGLKIVSSQRWLRDLAPIVYQLFIIVNKVMDDKLS